MPHTLDAAVPPLCTEAEISGLVHSFYRCIRQDEQLGPIFNLHVDDWDRHLSQLVNFWSTILLRTHRFSGAPLPKHAALPGLSAALFERWLHVFRASADAQPNRAMANHACAMAARIAQSFWMGYQINRDPNVIPTGLAHG